MFQGPKTEAAEAEFVNLSDLRQGGGGLKGE